MPRSLTRRRPPAKAVTNERGERTVATNVSPELHARLVEVCRERRTTKSEVLRSLLERELSKGAS